MLIRAIEEADLDLVLELNQGALDAVGPLDLQRLSPNYAWFEENFAERPYTYLDRIVAAPGHRRTGIASLLYDAAEGRRPVGLEVFCEPPNVASLAFHAARGYEEIGRRPQSNGKTVAMLVKPGQQGDAP